MERTRQEKLNHIAEHYMKAMWQKAYGVLSDAHEAEDACQEAFIKIIRIVDEIRDVEELRTKALCCIIARNTAVDMARKRGHVLPTEDVYLDLEAEEPQGESPEDRVIAAEGVEEIRAAIGRLPEHYREVLTLRCLYDMKAEEAAGILGVNANTVNIRLSRARRLLKEELSKGAGEKQSAE